ncbi:hypothetical protein [Methanoplanus endosymbiosus]|uniref:Uncharacterized protein n=1 Tax=Methanoplanus endosymbiosus TaxID=33865 RepID=A0A9E7TKH7_9EURY|nr:hypothetical protein [Methanoplanus endosymbiosus]UUX92640.1 hypothetical protein L6E24_00495 [Methanoplanus endosymbiosus]
MYEIINYSKKGIVHNYKGLNIHIKNVFRERPENLELISEKILESGVRELISNGILYKVKKESFCITQKGNDYTKNNTKSEIIEKYSNILLTGVEKSEDSLFSEAFSDETEDTRNIPDNNIETEDVPEDNYIESKSNIENLFEERAGSERKEIRNSVKENSDDNITETDEETDGTDIDLLKTDKKITETDEETDGTDIDLLKTDKKITETDEETDGTDIDLLKTDKKITETDEETDGTDIDLLKTDKKITETDEETDGTDIDLLKTDKKITETDEETDGTDIDLLKTDKKITETDENNHTISRPEAVPAEGKKVKTPKKGHFSRSKAYNNIIKIFRPFKGSKPVSEPEMPVCENQNTDSEIIDRFNPENNNKTVVPEENTAIEASVRDNTEDIQKIPDNNYETEDVPKDDHIREKTDIERYFEERAKYRKEEISISVKENSDDNIAGTYEENTETDEEITETDEEILKIVIHEPVGSQIVDEKSKFFIGDKDNYPISRPEAVPAEEKTVKIPDKSHFSRSETYQDIINKFSPVKEAEPVSKSVSEQEKFLYGKFKGNSDIINRYNQINNVKDAVNATECAGGVFIRSNTEETRYITDKDDKPVSEISEMSISVKENSDNNITGTDEEILKTDNNNYAISRPEAVPAEKEEVKIPEKSHLSGSESYSGIMSRFSPVKEPEILSEPEISGYENQNTYSDIVNRYNPHNNDKTVVPEENITVEDFASDNQEAEDLQITLSGGSPETEELLLKLSSEDREILKKSLIMLGEKGDASVEPDIEKFLNDKSYEIFEAAFEALTKIRKESRK